ncbi:type I restriction endonuclease subunit M, partial [Klebsiella oxytoca]
MSRAAQRRHLETADEHQKALVDLIKAFGYRHRASDVFSDFVETSALSLSNAVDLAQRVGREARYMEIVKKYTKEEVDQSPKMLGHLVLTYERRMTALLPGSPAPVSVAGRFGESLGHTYLMLALGNVRERQFLT